MKLLLLLTLLTQAQDGITPLAPIADLEAGIEQRLETIPNTSSTSLRQRYVKDLLKRVLTPAAASALATTYFTFIVTKDTSMVIPSIAGSIAMGVGATAGAAYHCIVGNHTNVRRYDTVN